LKLDVPSIQVALATGAKASGPVTSLHQPDPFGTVGDYYRGFGQITDSDVEQYLQAQRARVGHRVMPCILVTP
jgi:predicted phosphoribosyltransferase